MSSVRDLFLGPFGVRAGWRMAMWAGAVFCLLVTFGTLAASAGLGRSFAAQVTVELAAALIAGWLLLLTLDRRPLGALGYAADPAAPRDAAIGLGLGAAAIGVAGGVLAVAGSARWVADAGSVPEYVAALARAFAFFAVAAAAEEALFRGYGFQALVQGIGAWPAVLLSSAAFALAHAANPSVDGVALANIFAAGVMLGWAYLRTRSLWFCTALHLGWNWAMSAVLEFPVSGMRRDMPLYDQVSMGPRWFTGGDFGPEGGVAATLVIVLLTLLLLRARWVRESPRMRALRPLVDDRLHPRGEAA
ncbi:MAG: CPBP family intramembrane glutamic endopeptidase [Longimicrobiaceae bacterium]